jgi:hypothetical protein
MDSRERSGFGFFLAVGLFLFHVASVFLAQFSNLPASQHLEGMMTLSLSYFCPEL